MALVRILTKGYVFTPLLAALGIVAGAMIFFFWIPGKPQVAVINIPFTQINEQSAFSIGAMLDYARERDSVKAVVVNLNSPGGGVADSEKLYLKMRQLRQEKPVVVAVDAFAASGAYLMSLGANHIYVKPASFVGSVGVFLVLPSDTPPSERTIGTGPSKQTGGSVRTFTSMLEMLKEAFVQTVVSERQDRLALTPLELAEARIYPGMEAVRLGLVDDIGDDTAAIDRAADLAGIANFGLVDVNVEVARIFNQKLERVRQPLAQDQEDQGNPLMAPFLSFLPTPPHVEGAVGGEDIGPAEANLPLFYYLYAPPAP